MCQLTPIAPNGCDVSGPVLGAAQLTGDEWNLGGSPAAGSVDMSVGGDGSLLIRGDLDSAPPCTARSCIAPSADTWVRGFPSVSYGLDQCTAGASPQVSHNFRLPMQVSAIPRDLIGTTAYTSQASPVTYDVAYDMWLNPTGTKVPCRANGTMEVMVWTDYDAAALLPQSMKVGTATIPFSVNGVSHSGHAAWSVYASNVYQGGRTAPWGGTVWLVLDTGDAVRAGAVSTDLTSALAAVGSLLQGTYGWPDFGSRYWLDTIPFGVEFGPAGADVYGAGPAHFSLSLNSYCLTPGTTLDKARC